MARQLAPHPRLYIDGAAIQRASLEPQTPVLKAAAEIVARQADQAVTLRDVTYPTPSHNDLLIRARVMQSNIVTLLVRYAQTRDQRYRDAVVRLIGTMSKWKYWSWIAMRRKDADPQAIFDLSYGENSVTLALAYDQLHGELTPQERKLFITTAWERSLSPFLHQLKNKEKKPFWYMRSQSNWNSVCCGGAGMLALAMDEDLPQARPIIDLVEASLVPFMKELEKTDGAWPEGIGYWNFGMRYAFMYLLSHENATAQRHPLLRQKATKKTLHFPLDFAPHGIACSFSESNQWRPLPIHFTVAQRLGETALLAHLEAHLSIDANNQGAWPSAAEMLLLHPRVKPIRAGKPQKRVVRLYRGQDWGFIADQWPAPKLYLSVRGGTTEVPHGHRDLTSYHCVVGDEAMISNLTPSEYLDTTSSLRRFEIFEMVPASKNVLLINGVGITGQSRVKTSKVSGKQATGLRIDATAAMGRMRDGNAADLYVRHYLLLGQEALLILDHARTPQPARFESRFHTFAKLTLRNDGILLTGQRQKLQVAFAGTQEGEVLEAIDATTSPGPVPHAGRWRTMKLSTELTLATLLTPGSNSGRVSITSEDRTTRVTVRVGRRTYTLLFSRQMRLINR